MLDELETQKFANMELTDKFQKLQVHAAHAPTPCMQRMHGHPMHAAPPWVVCHLLLGLLTVVCPLLPVGRAGAVHGHPARED